MLVLNTNQSWGGWYEKSNQNVFPDMYPNFNSALLLFLTRWQITIPNGWAISTLPAVETINGTPINYYFWNIISPQYYIWTWSWSDQNFNIYLANSMTGSVRFWTDIWLAWWELIWKEIIAWFYWIRENYINQRTISWTIQMDVWLLHQDWTITSIANLSFSVPRTSANSNQIIEASNRINRQTTNWVVAQAGDRIIVDYNWTCNYEWSLSWWQYFFIDFWNNYTQNDTARFSPIQISID